MGGGGGGGGGGTQRQTERVRGKERLGTLTGVSATSSVGDAEDGVLQGGLVAVVVQVDLGVDGAGELHHPDPHQVRADVKVVHKVVNEL